MEWRGDERSYTAHILLFRSHVILPSYTFVTSARSVFELSFVYELVYFIAGTCFPRKFQTSYRIALADKMTDLLRDRIIASL